MTHRPIEELRFLSDGQNVVSFAAHSKELKRKTFDLWPYVYLYKGRPLGGILGRPLFTKFMECLCRYGSAYVETKIIEPNYFIQYNSRDLKIFCSVNEKYSTFSIVIVKKNGVNLII